MVSRPPQGDVPVTVIGCIPWGKSTSWRLIMHHKRNKGPGGSHGRAGDDKSQLTVLYDIQTRWRSS